MQEPNTTKAHASFRLDIKFPIQMGTQGIDYDSDLVELWRCLSYRIMRRPDDLLAHTRRIRLCQLPALRDKLAGALMDLEHVLGSNGAALRIRLLHESEFALGEDTRLLATRDTCVTGRVLPTIAQLRPSSDVL